MKDCIDPVYVSHVLSSDPNATRWFFYKEYPKLLGYFTNEEIFTRLSSRVITESSSSPFMLDFHKFAVQVLEKEINK